MTSKLHIARADRLRRVRQSMRSNCVDTLFLSLGADLPWLTGYEAMPLERLTVLVVGLEGTPVLVVPALEAPRVPDPGDLFEIRPWRESEDPLSIAAETASRHEPLVAEIGGSPRRVCAVSDRAWARTTLGLQQRMADRAWECAGAVTSATRSVKDQLEIVALRAAGAAADRVGRALQVGEIGLVGRTEAEVSAEIGSRLIAEGHIRVNFAIVGSGPNGASPHHEAGSRIIETGDVVVCDFGGRLSVDGDVGYCSDITRTVAVGTISPEVAECYEVLESAQRAAVDAVHPGMAASEVDNIARRVIDSAGLGEHFIHRTGHGIGIEEHEDPYIVEGNGEVLRPGHAFSVEPGIYKLGRFGMRLEDIVVVAEDGVEALNRIDHSLVVV